jgi:hypothetical protein
MRSEHTPLLGGHGRHGGSAMNRDFAVGSPIKHPSSRTVASRWRRTARPVPPGCRSNHDRPSVSESPRWASLPRVCICPRALRLSTATCIHSSKRIPTSCGVLTRAGLADNRKIELYVPTTTGEIVLPADGKNRVRSAKRFPSIRLMHPAICNGLHRWVAVVAARGSRHGRVPAGTGIAYPERISSRDNQAIRRASCFDLDRPRLRVEPASSRGAWPVSTGRASSNSRAKWTWCAIRHYKRQSRAGIGMGYKCSVRARWDDSTRVRCCPWPLQNLSICSASCDRVVRRGGAGRQRASGVVLDTVSAVGGLRGEIRWVALRLPVDRGQTGAQLIDEEGAGRSRRPAGTDFRPPSFRRPPGTFRVASA